MIGRIYLLLSLGLSVDVFACPSVSLNDALAQAVTKIVSKTFRQLPWTTKTYAVLSGDCATSDKKWPENAIPANVTFSRAAVSSVGNCKLFSHKHCLSNCNVTFDWIQVTLTFLNETHHFGLRYSHSYIVQVREPGNSALLSSPPVDAITVVPKKVLVSRKEGKKKRQIGCPLVLIKAFETQFFTEKLINERLNEALRTM